MRWAVAWLWRRWRARYSTLVAALAVVLMQVSFVAPTLLLVTWLFELSVRESLLITASGAGFVCLGAGLSVLSLGAPRRALDAWGRHEPVDPATVWNAALELPVAYPRRANLFQAPFQLLVTVPLIAAIADLSVLETLIVAVAMVMLQIAGGLIFGVGMRILLRPVFEELVPDLPLDAAPARRGLTLRYRLLMAVWLTATTMSVVGATAAKSADSAGEVLTRSFAAGLVMGTYLLWLVGTGVVQPSLEPVRDLLSATRRVMRGDYEEIVPVTSADELGELAVAFNQMQDGLRQRASLQAAFGSYVDPALTQRLLESGSSVFEGEELELTVLFADVRDFTGFASQIHPADAVAHLNRLFDVIVPAILDHGGHANHYLGDGLLAIFGAPSPLGQHADAAVAAAVDLQQRVRAEFGKVLRLGVGINTGPVIAGTVGGGGRLEFTVIGDTVNIASRVEQATKETGDAILLTEATRAALTPPHPRLLDRGKARLRGKDEPTALFAINPFVRSANAVRVGGGARAGG